MSRAASRVLAGLFGLPLSLLAALVVLGSLQQPDLTLPAGALGSQLEIDGIEVRYLQAGHGPDVLLIHGSPGSLEDWSPIFDRLAARHRVTAYDRPGHGYSGGAERAHTPAANAEVALALIRALGLHDVTVVGHSYGGMTGLSLATQNPPELRGLVVVASRGFGPVPVEALYRLVAVPRLGAGVAALAARWLGPARIADGVRRSFGPNADRIPQGFVEARTRIWNRPSVTTTLCDERVDMTASLAEIAPRYAQIRKPVVLVYGEQDERFADAPRLAREIPGARLVSFAATGHYVQFARPDELLHVIEEAADTP